MKRHASHSIIILALVVCAACAPPPIKLTPEQIKSLALATDDLPGGYLPDSMHTGVITYQSLVDEGSAQTAEYVKSLEDVQIYRSAFERTSRTAGPDVIWSWIFVYKDETDAHGYFAEHAMLYPDAVSPRAPFPTLGQESIADYSATASGAAKFELYHVIVRQHNIVIYVAPLYDAGAANEAEIASFAKLLENKLLDMIKSL
jgi:hypothetical protein